MRRRICGITKRWTEAGNGVRYVFAAMLLRTILSPLDQMQSALRLGQLVRYLAQLSMRTQRLKRVPLFTLLVVSVSVLAVFLFRTKSPVSPTPDEAFAEIFGRNPPESISDIRYRFKARKNGYDHFLSFTISDEDLTYLMMHEGVFSEIGDDEKEWGVQKWHSKKQFEKLHDGNLPSMELASITKHAFSNGRHELVVAVAKNHIFCHYLVNSEMEYHRKMAR